MLPPLLIFFLFNSCGSILKFMRFDRISGNKIRPHLRNESKIIAKQTINTVGWASKLPVRTSPICLSPYTMIMGPGAFPTVSQERLPAISGKVPKVFGQATVS